MNYIDIIILVAIILILLLILFFSFIFPLIKNKRISECDSCKKIKEINKSFDNYHKENDKK